MAQQRVDDGPLLSGRGTLDFVDRRGGVSGKRPCVRLPVRGRRRGRRRGIGLPRGAVGLDVGLGFGLGGA